MPAIHKFLYLNRKKIAFSLMVFSMVCTSFVVILFGIVVLSKNELPDISTLITTLACASIGFPLFILALVFIEWLSKRRLRNKIFQQQPFLEFDKTGFTDSLINEHTKWYFTEETKEIVLDGYRIQCDLKRESPQKIEFKAFVYSEETNEDALKYLAERLKQEEIYFDFDGVLKIYDIRKFKNFSAEQLKTGLLQFVRLLQLEGFKPWKEEGKY